MAMDLFDLSGRIAIVTGASSGLGITFAEALAEAGANLVICARRLDKLENTAEKLRSLGVKCTPVQADVTRLEQIKDVLNKTLSQFRKLDILVNNAGGGGPGAGLSDDADIEEYEKVMRMNLTSAAMFSHLAAREMAKRGYGRIINNASVLGVVSGVPTSPALNSAAYSVSKFGMVGLTKAHALQWAKTGITVNAIAPAYFPSEFTRYEDPNRPMWEAKTPMGRLGRPEELKTAVLFLASEHSRYVTGQVLCVDGGYSVW